MNKDTLSTIFYGLVVGVSLTYGTYLGALFFGADVSGLSLLEILAVFFSYVCVYLCVYETRWNYPIGILGVSFYSALFYTQEYYAVALFNLYLVFSQMYGWYRWRSDDDPTPVTTVQSWWWVGYALAGLGIFGLLCIVNSIFGVTISLLEIFIVVLSGVAQLLLDNKKLETWAFWAVVNVLSIYFFLTAEQPLIFAAVQYGFFLLNTVLGFLNWKLSYDIQRFDDDSDGFGDCCLHSHRCYEDTQ